jgi:UDP-N-acetylmuramoylalanine--D-glutamate ligase
VPPATPPVPTAPAVAADPAVTGARRALVVGLGVTGRAVAGALVRRRVEVVAVDDHPTDTTRAAARSLAVELLEAPAQDALEAAVQAADIVLPSPGLPDGHPAFAAARHHGVPVRSEFDLAGQWDRRPVAAITGTDGKTTVTTMVTAMLEASGLRAVACGNTEVPLVEALDDPGTDVFVVEASSFRLGHSHGFRPLVATWLNFAADHLDVHADLDAYEAAKARIWADLDADGGVAVVNADDPVVLRHRPTDARSVTFSTVAVPAGAPPAADAAVVGGRLVAPGGLDLLGVDELPRALPHDVANALAAACTALLAGATLDGVRHVLRTFEGLPHRVQLVAEADGVRWYDDSKATTPHAALAAVAGFSSVVLVAGGRNKGLDLSVLARQVPPVRAVVAMGEAADLVADAFAPTGVPLERVTTDMDDVVAAAARLAGPGDAVVLSPACASFDWFRSYGERGDAFAAAVRRHTGAGAR